MKQTFVSFTEQLSSGPVLLCFGPAGCGASFYRRWAKQLDSTIKVLAIQLPGRESRHRDQRPTDFSALVERLADAIHHHLPGEYSIFGHSLGGALGFAVSQALEKRHGRFANTVIISARTVPDETRLTDIDPDSSNQQLTDFLMSLGCLPPQLATDAEAMAMYLPIIRDDLRLNVDAQHHPFGRINSRLVALSGESDLLATPAQMHRWSEHTHQDFTLHTCRGGHFFILEQQSDIVELLRRIVDGYDRPPALRALTGQVH
ncbi:thioesterase II family protein [Pseudomonas fluorescens]|uniref:Thioesterase n=1 Tax=Pseudomonas fluorescens TaxID=294 RepID=A0A944DVS4_PSEFL|nr:alpha/beta fold hydrolase [Pseudomonas fluorescens]MBT2298025.1 thioesterase [Pseudomonas fluorescens]MBT2309852.1 thioesterase [Pseudomonas fluorescens]MBT2315015.1 thioesterase [Pseudomonas fluorescens]MBT2327921.1 thioesterase [Pseudomonas fluorescens]MBT2345668.1 thioesterase [Pseudomonas fluorescens]